ncbi:Pentatricopeptide repeat-containing protein, mitochondrial [Vitis vinifera]|uniref:Pentatricopeptide repeat-containing protein, mitochondrial n=1 Tax=Vitis vinifera TaxID=29760 RepID=A0A438G9H3_VITVI|nr:Pentatricopeptide repeat-containing protein, mitochondrial [Vitis vinifera]
MTKQHDIKLLAGDYAVHLDLIAKIRGLASAEKFFEDLSDKMKGQPTCTALLHTYVQNKVSEKAEALMEKMSECGFLKCPLPYNHMISLYISDGQLEKVPGMIQELKKNTSPDVVTYNLWLTVCASQNDVETAEKGLLDKAATTLNEMEKRTSRKGRIAYSSLISLHTNMQDKDGVHRIWKKLKSIFHKMNDAEYTCMISSLVKLGEFEEAENLYSEWTSVSPTGDSRVPNILLAAYINKNEMEMAEKFYNQMVERGITPSYTTWELLTWDEKLVREVYKNLEEQGNIEGAEKVLVILRKAGHVSTEIYNWLLRAYAKAGKMPLIVAEWMKKDKVEMDEETHRLIKETSKMCSETMAAVVQSIFSFRNPFQWFGIGRSMIIDLHPVCDVRTHKNGSVAEVGGYNSTEVTKKS